MRKFKSELLRSIQKAVASPESENVPLDKSRREFLKNTGKIGLGLGLSVALPEFIHASAVKPRIVVVGAGIAGLNAAHYLKKAGLNAQIYEAGKQAGGRINTAIDYFGPGLTTEIGGEFVDSDHLEMLNLIGEFKLEVKDERKDPLYKGPFRESYFVGGHQFSMVQVIDEFKHYLPLIKKDLAGLGNLTTPRAKQLDQLSIAQYFDQIGLKGWLHTLFKSAYCSEYGTEIEVQSSLNFITWIGTDGSKEFNMFGKSDEIISIRGGNSMVTKSLAGSLRDQIHYEYMLTAVKSKGKGYVLSFGNGKEVGADYVILAVPFTTLRKVQIDIDGMTSQKKDAINLLGYGSNSKFIMGFDAPVWRDRYKATGYLFNDVIQNGWDSSRLQQTKGATFTCFAGGNAGKEIAARGKDSEFLLKKYQPALESIYPGANAAYNRHTMVADWPNQPFALGSYACYHVGQWTSINGNEGTPIKNVFFAGEHCSGDWQGFMNGGAQTGKDAAKMVVGRLKSK
jgi:monoamine oxidase